MDRIEKVILVGALLLALMLVEIIVYGGFGIGVWLIVGAYFICMMTFMKLKQIKMSRLAKWLFIPIILCTLCFGIFNNQILEGFNVLFLLGLLIIHGVEVFNKSNIEAFLPGWVKFCIGYGIRAPFKHLNRPVILMTKENKEDHKKGIKVMGKVLLGMMLAIPMLVVVTLLLISSDAAFNGIMGIVLTHISFDVPNLVIKALLVVVFFFLTFSYFYSFTHKDEKSKAVHPVYREPQFMSIMEEDKREECQGEMSQKKVPSYRLDFVIVSTVVTMLCLIYFVFCLSQSAYFVSSFKGVLPKGFTFAEYARRGFFETLPITVFNFIVLLVLGYIAQIEQGKKRSYIKGMISFITVFTLFIVISALAKMCLYMQEYGLSLKRIYVAWFLCLCILVILIIFAKVFWKKLQGIKVTFIVFTVMYLGLNYCNVDYLVARQNVDLYRSGKVVDLSGCYNLSSSAMGPISELIKANPDILKDKELESMIEWIMFGLEDESWKTWNIADYLANKSM